MLTRTPQIHGRAETELSESVTRHWRVRRPPPKGDLWPQTTSSDESTRVMPVDFLSTCFCAPLSILGFLLLCTGGWLHGKFMQVCRQIISKVGSSEGSAYAVSRRECSGSAWRQALHELPVMTGFVHANFSTKFTYKARRALASLSVFTSLAIRRADMHHACAA